jgi:hypothetical protein
MNRLDSFVRGAVGSFGREIPDGDGIQELGTGNVGVTTLSPGIRLHSCNACVRAQEPSACRKSGGTRNRPGIQMHLLPNWSSSSIAVLHPRKRDRQTCAHRFWERSRSRGDSQANFQGFIFAATAFFGCLDLKRRSGRLASLGRFRQMPAS